MIIKRRKPKVVDGTSTQEGNVHRSEELQGGMGCPSGQRTLWVSMDQNTVEEIHVGGQGFLVGDG